MRVVGARVFEYGRDTKPGDDWHTIITKSISEAEVLLLFWSMHAAESRNVRDEVLVALREKKRIVPILLDSAELWDEIAGLHYIDYRQQPGAHEDAPAFSVGIIGLIGMSALLAALYSYLVKVLGSLVTNCLLAGVAVLWIRYLIVHRKRKPAEALEHSTRLATQLDREVFELYSRAKWD